MDTVKVRRFLKHDHGEWVEQKVSNFNGSTITVVHTGFKTRFEFEFKVCMKLSCVFLLQANASGAILGNTERIKMQKISLKKQTRK